LTEYLIGAGGWAYFQVPDQDSLEAYSEAYNFVEVNSTFYDIPDLRMVESWRRRVPDGFKFAVRCNRELTRALQLESAPESQKIMNRMISICEVLRSELLHIQTPQSLEFTDDKVHSLKELIQTSNLKNIRVALEIRWNEPLSAHLIETMTDLNLLHCVDISKEELAYESDILYTRLFGKGQFNTYQFTDEELLEIDRKATQRDRNKVAISFHGLRMYTDAARLKIFKELGSFPQVTKYTGERSLLEVMREDTTYPTTKEELLRRQGWKIFDLTPEKRIRASEILKNLPFQRYQDIKEVSSSLKKVFGKN
jgi:uncharacterized protein YecE (DUF72 family)